MASSRLDSLQVASLLECSICLEKYNDPRALPCLHSFCLGCLKGHVSATRARDGSFACPQCRDRCVAPGGDVEKFPKNFILNSLENAPASRIQQLESTTASIPCEVHKRMTVDMYCTTCTVPGCSDCMRKEHEAHEIQKLSEMKEKMEQDLIAVPKMAAKRIASLQQISKELDSSDAEIRKDLQHTNVYISEAAEDMRNLITHYETMLKSKVKRLTETARKKVAKAKEEVQQAQENTSSLKTGAETLHSATAEPTLLTVMQAPINKQQFLQQQDIPVPSVQWKMNRTIVKPGETSTGNLLGDAGMETSVEQKKAVQAENVKLQAPLQTIKLQNTATWGVGGIAPIYNTMVCVINGDEFVWVYTEEGELKQKVSIPGIKQIFGMVAVDGKQGKLAIVDGTSKVHFVTLSVDLGIQVHTTKDVPLAPGRISMSGQRQLIVSRTGQKKFAVLTADGELLHNVDVNIPHEKIKAECIIQTKSGYVVCDTENKKVYFTDDSGHIVHTSTDCEYPFNAVQTSWRNILIADRDGHEIKVFSDVGDFLGSVQDKSSNIKNLYYFHLDEAERLLYVACGLAGALEVRTYRFTPGDLPPLPITRTVTKMTMTLKLADVQ